MRMFNREPESEENRKPFSPPFIRPLGERKEFAGYVWEDRVGADGKRRREPVYRGDYYYFNYRGEALRAVRVRCGILVLSFAALFLVCAGLLRTSDVSNAVLSISELFCCIPLIYQIMGLWTLCRAPEPFEMKVPLTSVRRMKSSGLGILCLLLIAFGTHVYGFVTVRDPERLAADIALFAVLAVCAVLQMLLRKILLSFHLEKIEKESAEAGNGTPSGCNFEKNERTTL